MRILIYGAGAMGLYFAATLAQAGHDIHLKARTPWPLSAGSQPEITVQRADGTQESVSIASVFTDVPDSLDVDAVLIATKAWQVPGIVEELDGKIPASAVLLTVQNGITAPEHCARTLLENPRLPQPASSLWNVKARRPFTCWGVKRNLPWGSSTLEMAQIAWVV